jgi:hypothetical protein
MMRPYYVHVPTCAVYEFPALAGAPLGTYSQSTGYVTLTQSNNLYSGSSNMSYGSGYRSLPPQGPYSGSALALQGGRYPMTTMSTPNRMAYSSLYGDYGYGSRYG